MFLFIEEDFKKHTYQMRQILWLVAILLSSNVLQAQETETLLIGEILNKAGSERMLTQRMAKSYIALYLGTDVRTHKDELDGAVLLFEKRLRELKAIRISARYAKRIEKVNTLWSKYKNLVQSRPTKENILLLLEENNTILEACDLVTKEVEWYANRFADRNGLYQMNASIVHLENRSGQQRMLTERVLLYFLANHALIGSNTKFDKELNLALEHYQTNLTALMGATENTPEIDYRLILLSKEWEALSTSCGQKEKDFSNIEKVLKMGKGLLEAMEEITKNYEVLIDLRVASLLLNNAIDLAGQQNVLTQRIIKTYILEGISKNTKYQKERQKDIDRFEQNIDELKLFSPMDEITEALNIVDALWTDYRNEAMNASTKEGAQKLLYSNNELLRACDNVSMLLELYAKIYKKNVRSYNYAMADWIKQIDHQEMLTERILMYSYALSWGIKKEGIAKELEKTGYEYLENFNKLSLSIPIPNIQKRGENLVEKWREIKNYLQDTDSYREELSDWSEDLATELGDLTELYREKINGMVEEEAIEKANQQCMLSQKMAANYLAVAMDLNGQHQAQQLEKDKLVFQKQLEELKSFAQTASLKNALASVSTQWERCQTVFRSELVKEDVASLLEVSQEMLVACESVVKEINETANRQQVTTINAAAHLRTRTEQVLLYCLAGRWSQKSYENELNEIFSEYEKSLKLFHNYMDDAPALTNQLTSIERYFKRFKEYGLKANDVDLYALLSVHNVLLLETEKLTKSSSEVTLF